MYQEALTELEEILEPLNTEVMELLYELLDDLGETKRARMMELFEHVAARNSDDSIMQFVFDYPEQIGALFDE